MVPSRYRSLLSRAMLALGSAAVAAEAGAAPAGNGGPDVTTWISSKPAGMGKSFAGFVRSSSPFVGRYELVAERVGAGGKSSTRQGGAVNAPAGMQVRLSELTLAPLAAADEYRVVLTLYRGDTKVATAQLKR